MNNTITVSGIEVLIERKDIKNLHLAVYPPYGMVRVAVPEHITDDNVRLAVISKLNWIKKQKSNFKEQPRQSKREMLSGETHYFFGKRYRLEIIKESPKNKLEISNNKIFLYLKNELNQEKKELLINKWYREELKKHLTILIEKWEAIIGIKVNSWGIRKMKTKWGSCNIEKKHILINSELAKKPFECIEYIVVHEMVHFLERHHNDNFKFYMDKFFHNWKISRDLLNNSPLAHENWKY